MIKKVSKQTKTTNLLKILISGLVVVATASLGLLVYVVGIYITQVTNQQQVSNQLLQLQADVQLTSFDQEMRTINPDFIAWLTVDSTNINYPVVRGPDNIRYLDTAFNGSDNMFGTVFMDYRNHGEHVPHIILYGHHTRHNNMFSQLHNFLEKDVAEGSYYIHLMINGRMVSYRIFSARLTDVYDSAYHLDFTSATDFTDFLERNQAPLDAQQIITLSTCVSGALSEERVIVQGFLIP